MSIAINSSVGSLFSKLVKIGNFANQPFDKLLTALRTALDGDGTLDKEATSYNDIFDAFRLAQVLFVCGGVKQALHAGSSDPFVFATHVFANEDSESLLLVQ